MKLVLDAIEGRQRQFAAMPFFRRLEQDGPLEDVLAFVPGLTFFTLTFQDILRLCEARMTDPVLRRIARHHRFEEKGHDRWFLKDLSRLGASRDLPWVFGPSHEVTRDAAYALVSEVFRATDDRVLIALLEVLEATGEVFFSRIPEYLFRAGYDGPLDYFSWKHREIERSHMIFEAALREELMNVVLPDAVRAQALASVERSFDAFTLLFADLEGRVIRASTGQPSSLVPNARDSHHDGSLAPPRPER